MTQELMSDAVLDKVENIAAFTSKKEKEALIAEHWKDDRLFRTLVSNALDPFITFGIQKIPKFTLNEEGRQFNATTIRILKELRDRSLTGKKAQEAVSQELSELNPKSAELFSRIIKCNLKAGFSESSVNKAVPNAIYVFKPMLAHSFDDYCHELTYPVYAEVKEDGVRGFCLETKDCEFVSRNGLPLFGDKELKEQAYQLMRAFRYHWGLTCSDKKVVIDGEMVEANDCFNDSVGGARRKGGSKTMMFKVIDVLWQEEFDNRKSKHTYEERRKVLNKIFSFEKAENFPRLKLVDATMMANEEHCRDYFKRVHGAGKEGLIIKPKDGHWEGKRSKAWLKMKGLIDVDLVVKDLVPGEEGKEFEHLMGAAICDYKNSKGNIVEVRIGGGWSIEERAQHWANYHDEPVVYTTKKDNQVIEHTVEPNGEELVGKVIQVHAHEETKDGSLRHPRFVSIRTDKTAEDGQGC